MTANSQSPHPGLHEVPVGQEFASSPRGSGFALAIWWSIGQPLGNCLCGSGRIVDAFADHRECENWQSHFGSYFVHIERTGSCRVAVMHLKAYLGKTSSYTKTFHKNGHSSVCGNKALGLT